MLKKSGKTWGDVIEPNASLSDIDSLSLEKFIRDASKSKRLPAIEHEKDITQIFHNLQLIEDDKLKRAAVLLFGKEPHWFFIGAFAKIGKFGKSDHDLQSQEVVEGNAYTLADQILEILDKKYFVKTITYDGIHRVETSPYPYEAIREALINAIIHRSYIATPIQISLYDDKLMIWNPGELPEQLTFEDLKRKHASFPKNPRLADIFFKGGLIEAWGRGTLKIIDECKNHGLPEPKIEYNSGGINIVFFRKADTKIHFNEHKLNKRQLRVLEYLNKNEFITNTLFQELFSVSKATATRDLTEMVEKYFLLKRIGETGIGTRYKLKGS